MSMRAIKPSSIDLGTLLNGFYPLAPEMNREVAGVAIDSRLLRPGELFFALSGTRRHGREYVEDACRAGAAAVLLEDEQPGERLAGVVPVISIPDLRFKAGHIIARYFGDPSRAMNVIGVTGTNGKSTVTHLIAESLACIDGLAPCGIVGTLGWGFPGRLQDIAATTPDPVTIQTCLASLRDERARCVSMEVSSHALDQGRVDGVRFAVVVLTNLTRDHLDYHGDMESYAAAKRRLFEMTDVAASVINMDDQYGMELLARQPIGRKVFGYTLRADDIRMVRGSLLRGSGLKMDRTGISLDVSFDDQRATLQSRLLGGFNASNLLAALASLLALAVPLQQAILALRGIRGVRGRMEPVDPRPDQPLVVVDYAHTPDGLRQVLLSAREFCTGRLWCVFGCGGNRDSGKRPLMGAIAAELADAIVITSDNPRDEDPLEIIGAVVDGMPTPAQQQAYVEPDRAAAIALAINAAGVNDVVVVAGKGHESYQEVRGKRLPMSDHALVRAALKGRGG